MYILGISAYYHDSAAALIKDGEIVAAAQEERFTRIKHDPHFPVHAIRYCLEAAGIEARQIDSVVFYDKPFIKFERLLETYLAFAPRGVTSFAVAIPVWLKEKLFQKKNIIQALESIEKIDWRSKLLFSEHHLSHAASAFYPSPFEEAVILNMDGVGEWATTSVFYGKGNEIKPLKEIHFPHSIGLLYSAITYYTGFKVNSGEYKVMGLAPYGIPKYKDIMLDHLIEMKEDGSFHLNMDYFDYCTGLRMTNAKMEKLFGEKARKPEEKLTQFHMDVAASLQAVIEEVIFKLAGGLAREYGSKNLCLAGGVALNCVANGKLLRSGIFKNIWIQPAAGDAGGALGAAYVGYHLAKNQPRVKRGTSDDMKGSYLGPVYSQEEIEKQLTQAGARFTVLDSKGMIDATVDALKNEKAVGWMQGRMEFGPRALGARSILGDPRSPSMQKTLNLRVKFRESFRPFAPVILREDVSDWFDLDTDSPYMLIVSDVLKKHQRKMTAEEEKLFGIEKLNVARSTIPAVTHVDYSARIQTVHKETNPVFHQLLTKFKKETGCPVLVNTSFNVRGEPIVNTPKDAFRCFMGSDIEVLVVGNCFMKKEDQDPSLKLDYKNKFELD